MRHICEQPQISEAAQQLQRDVEVFEWLTRGQAETSKDEAEAGEEEEEEEDSHGEIGQGTTFNKLARDGRVGFNRGQSSAPATKRRPRAKTRQQTPRVVRCPSSSGCRLLDAGSDPSCAVKCAV